MAIFRNKRERAGWESLSSDLRDKSLAAVIADDRREREYNRQKKARYAAAKRRVEKLDKKYRGRFKWTRNTRPPRPIAEWWEKDENGNWISRSHATAHGIPTAEKVPAEYREAVDELLQAGYAL